MKWLKRIGVALGVFVLILAVVPLFISLDGLIPTIEKEVSASLKAPVKVGSLRAGGLPLPHVTVSGITVGKTDDIKVGSVTVTPNLLSLLGDTKVIRSIEVDGLVLTQNAVDKIPAWTKTTAKPGTPAQPPAVRVESIRLDDAVVKLQKTTFGPFDARLSLTGDGNLESASIVSRDGKLKAFIKPDEDNYLIDISASSWKMPVEPAIHFDELVIKGVATLNDVNLSDVHAKLYGGSVTGKLTASWEKGLRLKGHAEVNHIEIQPMLLALGNPPTLSGMLTAKPVVFSASASRPDQIMDALYLETPFDVQNGVLNGIDIKKAATSLVSQEGSKGGDTQFDKFSGHLAIARGTRRLTQLNVVSGLLAADGNVTISPKDELSGRVHTTVKLASVTATSVALNVSGTVDSPLLLPSSGMLAGAAAGTAVLGPGLGTVVGSRMGQWTEGLLDKKEKKKK